MNIITKRKDRHSLEQIVRKIQDVNRILAEGGDVVAVLRELNVTEANYYRWRNPFGGLKAEVAKMLKFLDKQNLPLKKLLAVAELEEAVLKELADGNFEARVGDEQPSFT